MKNKLELLLLFLIGSSAYTFIEIFYRGYSFRLMALAGGIIFVCGGLLNDRFSWKMDLTLQCFLISLMTTCIEAVFGTLDYYYLHLNMWDYSTLPFNYFHGKICLPFSIIWFFFGFIVVFCHDAICYYWLHKGSQPRYYIWGNLIWKMPKRKCTVL